MFLGKHPHGLDDKGRLVLPSSFRSGFKDGAVLAPWDGCIAMWTTERFKEVSQIMRVKLSEGGGEMGPLSVFFGECHQVKPDAQGRFVVPESQRRYAGLERDAFIVGQLDRVEIWDRDRFAAFEETNRSKLAGMIKELRL